MRWFRFRKRVRTWDVGRPSAAPDAPCDLCRVLAGKQPADITNRCPVDLYEVDGRD